jgi:hypothetical protein
MTSAAMYVLEHLARKRALCSGPGESTPVPHLDVGLTVEDFNWILAEIVRSFIPQR